MKPATSPVRPFLVVPYATPIESSGTSIVLRRLLANFAPEEVVLLGRSPDPRARLASAPPHYPVVRIASLPQGIRGDRYWRLASSLPGLWAGWRAIRRYSPNAILGGFPDEVSLLLAYGLHRLSGLPLLAYFCDLYMEDRAGGWQAHLARWLQPRVFRAASRVIAINRGMAEFYARRYGLDAACVPTCINVPIPPPARAPEPGPIFVVGYSGNINPTRSSSLRALVSAIGGDPAFAIRYFTPHRPEFLRSQGLWADNASASFVGDEGDLVRQLARCDALFLPLTFDVDRSSYDQLATCFGIKSYEYFLSQRPVLLQSPGDYFIARFYRERVCGLVVDSPAPEALRAALERLRADGPLRERLSRNALTAASEFEGPRVAAVLRGVLDQSVRHKEGHP